MSIQQIFSHTVSVAVVSSIAGVIGTFQELGKESDKIIETYYNVVLQYPRLSERPLELVKKYDLEISQARSVDRRIMYDNFGACFLASTIALLIKRSFLHFYKQPDNKEAENKANLLGVVSFSAIALYLTKPKVAIYALIAGVACSYLTSIPDPDSKAPIGFSAISLGVPIMIELFSFDYRQACKIQHMVTHIMFSE